jgi:hypothetical protein
MQASADAKPKNVKRDDRGAYSTAGFLTGRGSTGWKNGGTLGLFDASRQFLLLIASSNARALVFRIMGVERKFLLEGT